MGELLRLLPIRERKLPHLLRKFNPFVSARTFQAIKLLGNSVSYFFCSRKWVINCFGGRTPVPRTRSPKQAAVKCVNEARGFPRLHVGVRDVAQEYPFVPIAATC